METALDPLRLGTDFRARAWILAVRALRKADAVAALGYWPRQTLRHMASRGEIEKVGSIYLVNQSVTRDVLLDAIMDVVIEWCGGVLEVAHLALTHGLEPLTDNHRRARLLIGIKKFRRKEVKYAVPNRIKAKPRRKKRRKKDKPVREVRVSPHSPYWDPRSGPGGARYRPVSRLGD